MTITTKWELGDKVRMKDFGQLTGHVNAFYINRALPTLMYEIVWVAMDGKPQSQVFAEAELEEAK